MLATTNKIIRTGRGAYEISRADEGPGPLTFLFFERWALVARDACGGLVIIDGCPLTGISPHRMRLRRILQRGPPTRTNPAHVATIDLICVDFLVLEIFFHWFHKQRSLRDSCQAFPNTDGWP